MSKTVFSWLQSKYALVLVAIVTVSYASVFGAQFVWDDDENILSLERTILEQKGFHVTTAGGGEEALRLLREQPFDLVLLDVMMPDRDGFEVCRQIKQDARTRALPVIFLTAKGGGEALAEGFESGAVMYINKPFTANKLLTIVNTMLEQAAGQ